VRARVPGADPALDAFEREVRAAGGLLAGGVAYRLFLWLLPFGLLLAALLGYWVEYDADSAEEAAEEFGIGGAAFAEASNAVETSQQNRLLLVLAALVLLGWFSLGAVRAFRLAYALAWGLERPRLRRPFHAAAAFNGLLIGAWLAALALAWLREAIGLGALLGALAGLLVQIAVALVAMWLLPHRAERWQELLPGAVLVAVGSQLLQVAVVFYFAPRLGRSSELYGALGTAAVLLVWLYVLARLITGAAFLNATLWQRRQPA
jgi:uncharacterized BrkB/YihY/UPF0761 family membrane protein